MAYAFYHKKHLIWIAAFRGCMNPLVLFLVRLRAGDIGSATVFAQHVIEGLDDEPLQRLTEFD